MDSATRKFRRIRFVIIVIFLLVSIFLWFRSFSKKKTVLHADQININSKPYEEIVSSGSDFLKLSGRVRKGENLASILAEEKIDKGLLYGIVNKAGEIFNLKKIRAGNGYCIGYDYKGFRWFRYDIDRNKYFKISIINGDKINGEIIEIPYDVRLVLVKGVINDSLYGALINSGERGELADMLATLYEYDIDFNRDIRSGDSYNVLIEKKYLKGKFSGYGEIYASEFINKSKSTKVVRFVNNDGKISYYHPDGRAVKKMFLRCPLPFMRITSRFGFRKHPVLGFSASHKGIDLGAPSGTVVRVTADGIVDSVGYNRVKGRYIVVRHGNRYRTHYYHLSGIKKGIKRGKWVPQSTVIGYVGNTGRSTGPHLHYGLQRGRGFINPLRLKSPSRDPIKRDEMKRFKFITGMIFGLIELNNNPILNGYIKYRLNGLISLIIK